MRRGEVWWADFPPPKGRRPVLLVSRNRAYAVRESVTVAPLTTRVRGIPVEVTLGPDEGLPKSCVVNLDNLDTIEKRKLLARVTVLTDVKMSEVDAAIRYALGMD